MIFWFRHQEQAARHGLVRSSLGAIAAGGRSGILGVGAGFVVVPALRLASGLTIARAVATSSLVLAINSIAALIVRHNEAKSIASLWLLALASVAGAISAGSLSQHIPSKLRHRGLSILLLGFAIVTLVDALSKWALSK